MLKFQFYDMITVEVSETMKVLLYKENYEQVKDSGVGKAIMHQEKALSLASVDFTHDINGDYDIVHLNTVFPKSFTFAKKCNKNGIPVIFHAHSTMEDFKNSFMFSNQLAPLFKEWLTACYNTADLILTPTAYSKGILEEYKIKKPIEVISNGIDLDFWKPIENAREELIKKFGLSGRKIVISVGLYIKRKGILDFVELAKSMPEYDFVWFGYTNPTLLPPEINTAINTKLPNLFFPGYVTSEDLRLAYSGCDLYFFPTHEETEGIVLLEALATKAKVLVRDIEIYSKVRDGIEVHKAATLEGFEEKIKGILEGRLADTSIQGHKLVQNKDIKSVGLKLKTIYEDLIKAKAAERGQ